MSTEPGHSNSETHMTMDGKPDARFKEVSHSLHFVYLTASHSRTYFTSFQGPQLTDRTAVVSTEIKVVEKPVSRRSVMELPQWLPRVQARTPVHTSRSTFLIIIRQD
jgi:hypothetical protein